MDKFISGVGKAARFTQKKVQDGVKNLSSPPEMVQCSGCVHKVMVPPNTFNWDCQSCSFSNDRNNERCEACQIPRIHKAESNKRFVTCTMCGTKTEVQSTNAMKYLSTAATKSKELAVKAVEVTKKELNEAKSVPRTFKCQFCSNEMLNPNYVERNPETTEAEVISDSRPAITHVICSTCESSTSVPSMQVSSQMRNLRTSLSKSVNAAYYTISKKAYVNCPVCHAPVELPPKDPELTNANVKISMTCGKCKSQFPTCY